MPETARHLIVISADALSEDHWEEIKGLPNFRLLMESGTAGFQLRSVYPTLTYVAHTTMMTGCYPDRHGIAQNNQFQPFVADKDQTWYWYRHEVQCPTLYDLAASRGLRVAGLLWPVTGKSSIRYNLPEIVAIGSENQALKVLRAGSPLFALRLELKYGRVRRGVKQPELDEFVALATEDTIVRYRPELTLVHFTDLDDAKHNNGTRGPAVSEALCRMDSRIGRIMAATRRAGIYDRTCFVVLGDHGQIDIHTKVRLNRLLQEAGLIKVVEGSPQWRAYLQSAGGSAYLYTRPGDDEAESTALEILRDCLRQGSHGVEAIYHRAYLDRLRAHRGVEYAVEARPGFSFDDGLEGPELEDLKAAGITYATHGYSPDKPDYRCVFLAAGPGIGSGRELGAMEMVDIAPTLARLLGLEFSGCDGQAVDLT